MNVLIFTSPACGPCKTVKPALQALATDRGFDLRVVEATMTNQTVFTQYGVRAVPTIVCLDEGEEVGRTVGAITPAALEVKLNEWGL